MKTSETMAHVIVAGGNGFDGKFLVRRLLSDGLDGRSVERITLIDVSRDEMTTKACIF